QSCHGRPEFRRPEPEPRDVPGLWRRESLSAGAPRRPAAHHRRGRSRAPLRALPASLRLRRHRSRAPGSARRRTAAAFWALGAQATTHVTHAPADLQEELESAASSLDIDALIRAVATRYGVSVDLITAIIEAESEFNPRAVSRTGARGLM